MESGRLSSGPLSSEAGDSEGLEREAAGQSTGRRGRARHLLRGERGVYRNSEGVPGPTWVRGVVATGQKGPDPRHVPAGTPSSPCAGANSGTGLAPGYQMCALSSSHDYLNAELIPMGFLLPPEAETRPLTSV